MSRIFENVTETRGFYSADFLSGSGSSTEPVVLTRATHNGGNHGERRVSVKGILFSQHSINSGERQEAERMSVGSERTETKENTLGSGKDLLFLGRSICR